MENKYDIAVIGSGPGGYVAAIRAAQLGKRVALIEKYKTLGGTCTNVGCIPTKALLDSSEHYHLAQTDFAVHGIETDNLRLDFNQFIQRKDDVVTQNGAGLNFLMKKNKITVHSGTASFIDAHHLLIKGTENTDVIVEAAHIIIATGSKPATLPGVTIDKKRIITSTEALSLTEQPKSMLIIGGGVIGVEFASIFARLKTKVTIIEYADSLLPTMDRELGKALQKSFGKLDIKLELNKRVQSVQNSGNEVKVVFENEGSEQQELNADYCLVAIGRKAYTDQLNPGAAGVEVLQNGKIKVDGKLQTSVPNIYAIGDVINGPMLAHKAEEDGKYVAELICGEQSHLDYKLVPGVVYTWPEVASIGQTEEELKADNTAYTIGKFPFLASGRARASRDLDGFAKVLIDPKYGEVLGVHVIGARAADIISQATIAMKNEITVKELNDMIYPHPTFSEVLKEAYLIGSGKPSINI
ncbi:dihydrolipoyl dehydrogenase [Pedobacter sp. HMWF019]|uniref:dihydrolipoyl dehydrogenase n=1 Tax=Pedobacter sp. HMWF019 TaxID=2056856 RepID=UPI000D33F4CA|nr:dihydrolipoyl dehydrogenase [Pedobacter sp. HMWF019]PTT02368.1 dihydrolipoyl dehydrogenase [Pedobacter sp. HMWF019]